MKANLTILLLFGVCSIEAADRAKLAANQALRVDAPVAAFATVGAAQIRPIVGLPGLLRWSEPLALTESFARLSIAPGEQYAIGVSARRELVFLRLDASQSAVIARLSTELDSVDQILFSPSGASVAVRSAAGQVALVTSLPASPKIADTWSGVRNVLALSDDGELSLVDDGAIRVRAKDGKTLASLDKISAAAFFPGSQRLIVVGAEGSISFVENGAIQLVLESSSAAGARQVLVSDSSNSAFLATAERLWTLDLSSLSLNAELVEPGNSVLHRTRVRGRVLLVNEASGEVQLVSAGAEALQVDALRIPVEPVN